MNPILRDMFTFLGLLFAAILIVSGISWLVGKGVQRLSDYYDARYDRWGIRTDEQARTKGTVAVEDPTGGDES